LDTGGWYRPLTNRTLQSLLYPVFGLVPGPYRPISFVLFFADTLAVFAIATKLTSDRLAAVIATLLFAIHTVNAYTTYDLSFTPVLVYTFFYIGAVTAFFVYLDTGRGRFLTASVLLFVLSLCSKESAVPLPAVLGILGWIRKRRLRPLVGPLIPHAVILA